MAAGGRGNVHTRAVDVDVGTACLLLRAANPSPLLHPSRPPHKLRVESPRMRRIPQRPADKDTEPFRDVFTLLRFSSSRALSLETCCQGHSVRSTASPETKGEIAQDAASTESKHNLPSTRCHHS
ncbi:hypothetical protein Bbelb_442240 [Branchiostoma belcheri]|nr:hypothetical protein Bbelb_442240 [Branchiostoma belcheri]